MYTYIFLVAATRRKNAGPKICHLYRGFLQGAHYPEERIEPPTKYLNLSNANHETMKNWNSTSQDVRRQVKMFVAVLFPLVVDLSNGNGNFDNKPGVNLVQTHGTCISHLHRFNQFTRIWSQFKTLCHPFALCRFMTSYINQTSMRKKRPFCWFFSSQFWQVKSFKPLISPSGALITLCLGLWSVCSTSIAAKPAAWAPTSAAVKFRPWP